MIVGEKVDPSSASTWSAVASALVDREIAANRVSVLATEPGKAEVVAYLLVGGRGENEVAARPELVARERGDRHRAGRHLPLHVERAAAPDLPVTQLARER